MSTLEKVGEGAALGAGVTVVVTPLIYAKNMAMTKKPFVLGHCLRGVLFNGASVVPTTAAAFAVEQATKPHFGEMGAGFIAGFASGFISGPAEAVVQAKQTTALPVFKIMQEAKLASLRGVLAVAAREGLYAPSYMVLSPWIGKKLQPHIENQKMRAVVQAMLSGAVVGPLTTPFDVLRAIKQDQLGKVERPPTYPEIVAQIGMKGLFRGVVWRSIACSIAIGLMQEGRNYLSKK